MRLIPGTVLCLALFAPAAFAQSAAEAANRELPEWLRIGAEYRARVEGTENRGFVEGASDNYLLNRIRIDLTVKPTAWMKFVFEGQDSRLFFNQRIPNAAPYENSMDLRIGYLELGDSDKSVFSLRAGRQEINFGDQRLIGSSNWANVARSFDAVRAIVRYGGVRVDAFAASVVVPNPNAFDRPVTGDNLHGLAANFEKLIPRATIEPYLFWRLSPHLTAENGTRANLDMKTLGVRWVGKLPLRFDYTTEMALQRGWLGPDRDRAWAGHWVIGHTLPARWTPRLVSEYNYASGDKDPHDDVRGTFDHLYPTPHDKYGLCDQVGWRNIHDLRLGVETKPRRNVGLAFYYHNWWLASARDALYASGGAVIARSINGTAGTHVGQELDIQGLWTVNRQISIAAGVGHIFPGEFLKNTTPAAGYTFPFVMFNYKF